MVIPSLSEFFDGVRFEFCGPSTMVCIAREELVKVLEAPPYGITNAVTLSYEFKTREEAVEFATQYGLNSVQASFIYRAAVRARELKGAWAAWATARCVSREEAQKVPRVGFTRISNRYALDAKTAS